MLRYVYQWNGTIPAAAMPLAALPLCRTVRLPVSRLPDFSAHASDARAAPPESSFRDAPPTRHGGYSTIQLFWRIALKRRRYAAVFRPQRQFSLPLSTGCHFAAVFAGSAFMPQLKHVADIRASHAAPDDAASLYAATPSRASSGNSRR